MSLHEQLRQLAELRRNWNGYDEEPISVEAIARCKAIHFSPVSDGGIQIELTDGIHDVEVFIDPAGLVSGVMFDRYAGPDEPTPGEAQ